jgi:hypothetical protein
MGRATPVADLVTSLLAEARDELGPTVDHTRAFEVWSDRSRD